MTYDVIIVGAGPTGGMAARPLSKKGYKVLVIDRKKVVGYPVQCGEGMSHFALENNNLKPHDSWIKLKVKGAKPICPDGSCFYAAQPGYSMDRGKFDQWIINEAVDNGCELLLDTKVIGVEKKGEKWNVRTNKKEYEGKILVAADGFASNIARWLGLLQTKIYVKALQYKFDAKDVAYDETEWLCLYYDDKFQGGYGWVFPRGDEYNMGVGGYGPTKPLLKWFCKKLKFDTSKAKNMSGGCVPNRYVLSNIAKDGVMIVGDAAGMVNPMFGGGIHAALYSGRIAGEAACRALGAENISLTDEYETHMRSSPFMEPRLHKAAQKFIKWDNELFNFMGYVMDGKDQSDMTLWKGFLRTLKRPKFFKYSRQFLLLNKVMKVNAIYGW